MHIEWGIVLCYDITLYAYNTRTPCQWEYEFELIDVLGIKVAQLSFHASTVYQMYIFCDAVTLSVYCVLYRGHIVCFCVQDMADKIESPV